MKLNVGCGIKKLNGYLNVDINPNVKPDYIMPMWNLSFDDDYFNEVLAVHVVEHVGFFKFKYFVSEVKRVLKYEKFFIIETVNLEESFRLFLNAKNSQEKERVLSWIFGSETKYMNHIFCFPLELLVEILKNFGFEIIKIENYDYQYLRPAVRIISIKKDKNNMDSKFRKIIVENGIFDEEDEIVYYETERIINSIKWDNITENYLDNLSFISPIFSFALSKISGRGDYNFYFDLIKNNFTAYLFEMFEKYYKIYKSFDVAYNRLKNDFFDNPKGFIYNFIKDKKFPRHKRFILTETVLQYSFCGG
ncbi:MAG: hypothetical protein N2Z20_04205 [Elusimicrobiales bacterium]|nr:hypothetical protein [Elusimicrobiales bacterium]